MRQQYPELVLMNHVRSKMGLIKFVLTVPISSRAPPPQIRLSRQRRLAPASGSQGAGRGALGEMSRRHRFTTFLQRLTGTSEPRQVDATWCVRAASHAPPATRSHPVSLTWPARTSAHGQHKWTVITQAPRQPAHGYNGRSSATFGEQEPSSLCAV